MKILIFAPYYLPHNYGITVCIDEFAKFSSLKSEKITIVTPNVFSSSLPNEIMYGNVEIIRFPAFYLVFNYPFPKFWKLRTWKIAVSLFKSRNEYDVVITTIRFFIVTLFGVIYAKICKTKLIHIEQVGHFSILSNKAKMFIAKMYDYIFGKLIFKLADVNVAPSTDVRKFINKFDSRDVAVIFNSLNSEEVDLIDSDNDIRKKYEDKIIICYPGRMCKWKGIEDSVGLLKSLPADIKNKIVFLIIGYGEDFNRIKKISESEEAIVMLGELSRKQTIGILKVADIYLHSVMLGGGLSNSLLEAMYCKCAVVATPNEGAKDIIINGKNGFLAYSKEEMRNKLIELISSSSKRIIFGKEAYETVKYKFNWDSSIAKYWELIEKIMA